MEGLQVVKFFEGLLRQLAQELIELAPRLFLALAAITSTIIVIKIVNFYLRKLLAFSKVDEAAEKFFGGRPPLSPSSLVVGAADLGLGFIAVYLVLSVLLPEELLVKVDAAAVYAARVLSVLAMIGFVLLAFNMLMSRIKLETKLKSYMTFISFLLATALLIDVVALSDPVKEALVSGLAIGIGTSIAVFATWFFFADYIERYIRSIEKRYS
ncbi:MAG TPA: hypothetical protein ENG69_05495 [Candidatus Korarchaeota archaeon]|nr:hypothetical protein [Candidatus Korarchaeota archaeon]